MSLHTCPVCYGSGLVAADFYRTFDSPYGYTGSAIPQRETCRTCGGIGAVIIDGFTIQRLTPAVDISAGGTVASTKQEGQ